MSTELDLINTILGRRLKRGEMVEIIGGLSAEENGGADERWADLLHKLNALIEVSNQVADSLSLDTLLPRMIALISDALEADRSTLFLYDASTRDLYSRIAQGDAMTEIRFPSHLGIAGSVFASGEPILIPDAYADARFNQDVDRQTGYRTRNILCVPIRSRDQELIGVTQVLNKRHGEFTPEDQALLAAINTQASSALRNALLFEQVQKAREEEQQLLELTTTISTELELKPLLRKIMAQASPMLDADRSTLFLHDSKTGELWSEVAEGMATKEIRFPDGVGIAGSVFTTSETINIPDAYADARFNQAVDKQTGYKTTTILCMPVVTREQVRLGVIQVLNKRGGPFNATDERKMAAFCAQAAIAIENARLFDEVVEMKNFNESILQSLSDGVVSLDSENVVTKANDAAQRILRADEAELVGRPLNQLFSGPDQWVADSVLAVEATGKSDITLDREILAADERPVAVNLTTVPLLNLKRELTGSLVVFEDISTEKRVMSTLSRYMSKEVADQLLAGGDDKLGGTMQPATVLFSDIRSFTTISERIGARETVEMLNKYFSVMVETIFRHGGILDKYIGDAIMAVFGAPFSSPDDADNAVKASIDMLRALEAFNREQEAEGKQTINIGIGLNTDEILSGNIGSTKRMDYTVIGDGVNLASRLEGANKPYSTQLLVSEFTMRALQGTYRTREVDLIRVKGKEQPVAIFEVLDYLDPADHPGLAASVDASQRGLERYRAREWDAALAEFRDAVAARGADGVSALYIERCELFRSQPPAADWDGVWVMTSK